MTLSQVLAISTGSTTGLRACCSSDWTRPSQKRWLRYAAWKIVGEFRRPSVPLQPCDTSFPSLNPFPGRWQVAQATSAQLDRLGSKKSASPSFTLSFVWGLFAGTGTEGSLTPTSLRISARSFLTCSSRLAALAWDTAPHRSRPTTVAEASAALRTQTLMAAYT